MAVVKACNVLNTPKNTGKECDTAMVATAMIIATAPGLTFTTTDMLDPVTWLTNQIHLKKAFPMFGINAPIREITNNAEGDQIVTLDDGLRVFLRYGLYNREFATTGGGLCYAAALQSFLNSGYGIIEIDQNGQMLCRQNADGSFSGLICGFMYAPSPVMADLKSTPYKNRFAYTYSPLEFVNNGVIMTGASALLSMMGLIDATPTSTGGSTATILKIGFITECAGADLVAKFGTSLGSHVNNFVVYDKANLATPLTITSASVVSGHIELVGTWTSGHTFRVYGAPPANWQGNSVLGYDGSNYFVDIAIP